MTNIDDTKQNEETGLIDAFHYFPSIVYSVYKPEFLKAARKACKKAVSKRKKEDKLNEIYPSYMTESLFGYDGMEDILSYVGATAWNLLNDQGYAMEGFTTTFTEFWCQEHHKYSSMEQHIHGNGSQLVGFYFVDVPEGSSNVLFYDPRAAKVQIDLPERDVSQVSTASKIISFEAKEGTMMFANSWLPHSFTRHAGEKPLRFIHFNLSVLPVQQVMTSSTTPAVVI